MRIKDHLGNYYISRKEMCRVYGISEKDFRANLKEGLSLEESLKNRRSTKEKKESDIRQKRELVIDFQGNVFPSINKMCEAYNIPSYVYNQRVRKLGWDNKRALLVPVNERRKEVIIKGETYSSVTEAARAYGKTYRQVEHRVSDGWSLEDAVLTPMLERGE